MYACLDVLWMHDTYSLTQNKCSKTVVVLYTHRCKLILTKMSRYMNSWHDPHDSWRYWNAACIWFFGRAASRRRYSHIYICFCHGFACEFAHFGGVPNHYLVHHGRELVGLHWAQDWVAIHAEPVPVAENLIISFSRHGRSHRAVKFYHIQHFALAFLVDGLAPRSAKWTFLTFSGPAHRNNNQDGCPRARRKGYCTHVWYDLIELVYINLTNEWPCKIIKRHMCWFKHHIMTCMCWIWH